MIPMFQCPVLMMFGFAGMHIVSNKNHISQNRIVKEERNVVDDKTNGQIEVIRLALLHA